MVYEIERKRERKENGGGLNPLLFACRWLATNLEFLGNGIVLFAALFAVISKTHLSPGIVGFSISGALQVMQSSSA